MIGSVYSILYHLRLRYRTAIMVVPQGLLLSATVAAYFLLSGIQMYLVGLSALIISATYSFRLLSRDLPEMAFVAKIKRKLGL